MKRTRRHALGQHFLANRSVLDKIVRVIDPEPPMSSSRSARGRAP